MRCDVKDYGAEGDAYTDDTTALQNAIDTCNAAGGGTVVLPPGVYVSGTIRLLSHVRLHLEAGAVLKGSPDVSRYGMLGEDWGVGLVFAHLADNVAITGDGTIDGSGASFLEGDKVFLNEDSYVREATRQGSEFLSPDDDRIKGPVRIEHRPGHMIEFIGCNHLAIRDIRLVDSPMYAVHFIDCENIVVTDISIENDERVPNADGIHFNDCRDVRIANCNIHSPDDCIAMTGREFLPPGHEFRLDATENIVVANCTMQSGSSAIRVGYVKNPIRNCLFQNCVIRDSNRGIGVFIRGSGAIENILFDHFSIETRLVAGAWWGHGEPIHVSVCPRDADVTTLGRLRNVRFSNIVARGESGIVVCGDAKSPVEDLVFDNVRLSLVNSPLTESFGGNFDLRPNADRSRAIFAHDIPSLYACHTRNLRIADFEMEWDDDLPEFYTHGIECEQFEDLLIDGFRGRQHVKATEAAAIAISDGRSVTVRNCRAGKGAGTFLSHADVADARVFSGNDLRNAERVWARDPSDFMCHGNLIPQE